MGWRTLVNDVADLLDAERRALPTKSGPVYAAVGEDLERARAAAGGSAWDLRKWWNGGLIEDAWFNLHGAAQELLLLQDEAAVVAQIPEIEASLASALAKSDPRRVAYKQQLKVIGDAPRLTKASRLELRAMLRTAHDASDQAHGTLRTYRNHLMVLAIVLSAMLVGVGFVHYAQPKLVSVCASPSSTEVDSTTTATDAPPEVDSDGQPIGEATQDVTDRCPNGTSDPARSDLFQIELLGALGGAGAAIARAVRMRPSRSPYALPLVQTVVKLPAGAATALIGVLLMQHQVAGFLTPQTGSHLVGFAVLFGFSQEAATRFIDKQAGEVLSATSSKNDAGTEPSTLSSSDADADSEAG